MSNQIITIIDKIDPPKKYEQKEGQDEFNVNKPKSIFSKANDLSKLDSSTISNKNIKLMIRERNEQDKAGEISNNESEKEKKDSNFSSIRAICDELNRAEKYINENKK